MMDIPGSSFVSLVAEASKETIKIMSYNVLARAYTVQSEFPYTPMELLKFEVRAPRVIKEIASCPPDLLCIQEIDVYEGFYKEELGKIGYETQWMKKSKDTPDGVLIGYKKGAFELIGRYDIEFNNMKDFETADLRRNTVALALHLKYLANKKEILLTNTHIFYHHDFNFIKYSQMSYLLTELSAIYAKLGSKPSVVICGDFNVWPNSNVIRLLYGSPPLMTYPDVKTPEHKEILTYFWTKYGAPKIPLRSSYENYQNGLKGILIDSKKEAGDFESSVKGHPALTCITIKEYETLDYIFHSKELTPVKLLKIEDTIKVTPSEIYPSDHIRIMTEFAFSQ